MTNQRPGVYSSYQVAGRYATQRARQQVVLLADLPSSLKGQLHQLENVRQARELLGGDPVHGETLLAVELLLHSGAVPVQLGAHDCKQTLSLLSQQRNVGAVVGSAFPESAHGLLEQAKKDSENGREYLCFFGTTSSQAAVELAQILNHPRGVVVCGATSYQGVEQGIFAACRLAAVVVNAQPNHNFSGQVLSLIQLTSEFSEEEIQKMLRQGVTPLESVGQQVEVVRGVTSQTTLDGAPHYAWRSMNTLLIVDDIIQTLRQGLSARLKGVHTLGTSMENISSQVVIELENKKRQGLIESYQMPAVQPAAEDPSICEVEVGFQVAHVVSQIYITAYVEL